MSFITEIQQDLWSMVNQILPLYKELLVRRNTNQGLITSQSGVFSKRWYPEDNPKNVNIVFVGYFLNNDNSLL